jgi:hypothetical protein
MGFFHLQVLSHRKIYVFGELLEQPSVQSVSLSHQFVAVLNDPSNSQLLSYLS